MSRNHEAHTIRTDTRGRCCCQPFVVGQKETSMSPVRAVPCVSGLPDCAFRGIQRSLHPKISSLKCTLQFWRRPLTPILLALDVFRILIPTLFLSLCLLRLSITPSNYCCPFVVPLFLFQPPRDNCCHCLSEEDSQVSHEKQIH